MSTYSARLAALRDQLARQQLDGFVVPLTDEHMSEYVGAYAQRLSWLTGFQGSAGTAVVLPAEAAIFTDGRYTLQVREQVSGDDWQFVGVPETSVSGWLADHARQGARIGYDPWLHTRAWVDEASRALAAIDATLVPVDTNPVDAVWPDRPAPSDAPLTVQDDAHAGRSSAEKRAAVADWLVAHGADSVVLASLESTAWLLNVRGGDVSRTPVALSYTIVNADGTADLYVAPEKMNDAVAAHLGNAVRVHDRRSFAAALGQFVGRRVAVDPALSVAAIPLAIEAAGGTVVPLRDPTVIPRATKNAVEQAGHRAASIRDGAALSRFLRWIAIEAPKGGQTELSAAAKLEEFRRKTGVLKDLSFDAISATGPHGAIPHYHVTEESNLPIEPGQLYLIDSGGQYVDGTTDVTRVVPIGHPTQEMRDRFTRVLKGHIALATAVFPRGTTGAQLDALARLPLWQAGLDFAHGTGHGVGSYLSVHEGPARIAKPSYPGAGPSEPLLPGMILSNEPGYYKAGEYGIRIENLLLVHEQDVPGGESTMLAFETLTLAPIDRDLVDPALLTPGELSWLNDYHARVAATLAPVLEGEEREWIVSRCSPITVG
ncbi:aminopeptidase P family protein [Sphingomonas sp. ABOLG]|uniref:aminopeptidase P family protein n=1 Tax=Sphingomonas sp. ABOLG TaxID=1985880 RepID=UPI000F7D6C56|nr:aminopeptidase P family protein [Sphingomonas sp. ABOLG]RSV14549.1 aminopeptidase P family protein [Sphingomonas sp. ABOLG]